MLRGVRRRLRVGRRVIGGFGRRMLIRHWGCGGGERSGGGGGGGLGGGIDRWGLETYPADAMCERGTHRACPPGLRRRRAMASWREHATRLVLEDKMRLRSVLAVIVSAPALLLLIGTGCGIISAPFSVPEAIAANHNAHLDGTITDPADNPLGDVTLSVQKTHRYWDPAMGERDDFEDSSALVSGKFSVSRRASSRIRLTFTKPGYVPAMVEFDEHAVYLSAAATTQAGAADEQKVPDTRPSYGGYFNPPTINSQNTMYVDPSWRPGQAVRVILYPVRTKSP